MRDRDGLHLDLRGYAGPLDLLLELVRAGRVDVGAISLLDLAVQFEAALEGAIGRGDVPLSRLGDWLVAAANLALLRSRLLLPEDSREGREARLEAEALRRQLADRAAVAALADWLGNRRQLGRQVFARGAPEHAQGEVSEGRGATPVADLTTLLRACLELMSRPERVPAYRPNPPDLWRPPAAVARMRRLLGEMADLGRDEALPLEHFLPSRAATPTPLQRRAALASTLVAGLELARDAAIRLEQHEPFGQVGVSSPVAPSARVA
ncbi:segregation/condensation protein A [Roseomonas sp. CCTCC AB2023176]|uniref:segregation/condensation protein A n=1 Tax=Roseomonas sp. CCTCC AB2023176 TaxID=3342640 RepID=UPI0035DFDBD9